ncbi:MAG: cysteine peptidase family C39 domain-containing protein [Planctomycetota bacterium]|jgi:hypothetical protein
MLVAAIHVLLDALGAAAGVAVARRSLRLATFFCLAALAVVLSKFAFFTIPAAEARLFPWDFYPYVEPWWAYPFVFFLLGAALYAARRSMIRRDLLLVFGRFLLLRVMDAAWADVRPHPPLTGTVNEAGFCAQTSAYSCGAASAAMFLHLHGIETTEDEMARLCVTRSGYLGGTTEAGVLRGLRRKGLQARVCAPEEITAPAIVPIRLNWFVGHFVVVRRVRRDRVLIADPTQGFYIMSMEKFRGMWQGSAIEVLPES